MWDKAIASLVARWLDNAMHERRVRKAELGRITGIDRSVIDRYLKAKSVPPDETIDILARALEVAPPHPCDLMTELDIEFPTYTKGLVDAARKLNITMQELLRLAADESAALEIIGARVTMKRLRRSTVPLTKAGVE
jgi:transcriptional regulator with XRE-family HTH domain